jgi:hypothetical protein
MNVGRRLADAMQIASSVALMFNRSAVNDVASEFLDPSIKCLRYNSIHEIFSDHVPAVALRDAAHQWAGSQWLDWAMSDARSHERRQRRHGD